MLRGFLKIKYSSRAKTACCSIGCTVDLDCVSTFLEGVRFGLMETARLLLLEPVVWNGVRDGR